MESGLNVATCGYMWLIVALMSTLRHSQRPSVIDEGLSAREARARALPQRRQPATSISSSPSPSHSHLAPSSHAPPKDAHTGISRVRLMIACPWRFGRCDWKGCMCTRYVYVYVCVCVGTRESMGSVGKPMGVLASGFPQCEVSVIIHVLGMERG